MAMDFPSNPLVGQDYVGYVWDGEKWNVTEVVIDRMNEEAAKIKADKQDG